MATRRLGVSEARRLLPELVKGIARDGGRVDITYRGEPQVSILRVSDVRRKEDRSPVGAHSALRVEIVHRGDLVGAIRRLRTQYGHPRKDWLTEPETRAPANRKTRRGKRPS